MAKSKLFFSYRDMRKNRKPARIILSELWKTDNGLQLPSWWPRKKPALKIPGRFRASFNSPSPTIGVTKLRTQTPITSEQEGNRPDGNITNDPRAGWRTGRSYLTRSLMCKHSGHWLFKLRMCRNPGKETTGGDIQFQPPRAPRQTFEKWRHSREAVCFYTGRWGSPTQA